MKPPSGFVHGTPGSEIHHLNYYCLSLKKHYSRKPDFLILQNKRQFVNNWINLRATTGGFIKRRHVPFYFLRALVIFYNHFEELQTVLFEVELITDNAPLPYLYPITIEKCLIANHLLFGWQLLYYFKEASTTFMNLTVLSSTAYKINHISNHFWHGWRHEYLVNLCDTQQTWKFNINSTKTDVKGALMLIWKSSFDLCLCSCRNNILKFYILNPKNSQVIFL